MTTARRISLRANAKLNLFLRVLSRRADGYHELDSIFHAIDLADEVAVETSSTNRIVMRGLGLGIPENENLAGSAVRVAAQRWGSIGPVSVEITKMIPAGAGLGGGSADAAAAIAALDLLFDLDAGAAEMSETAAGVGSDVPFWFGQGSARVRGRGEQVESIAAPEPLHVVLGMSAQPLSTREVYAMWDAAPRTCDVSSREMALALGAGDSARVAALLHNDLEGAAFRLRPDLASKKESLLDAGALGAGLTGSGATLFALVRSAAQASDVAEAVRGRFDRVEVATSARRPLEVVGGGPEEAVP